ncbi:hypothetical protein [Luteolibacter sp. Populi]|uniref:hypothetical protein n=1 Tax=Luteolibacter sp. Populi TaxID=3230487 RepID=UPI0034670602
MATETLSFLCPHCDIRLTVPIALAGVKGPCPNCRLGITAPVPATGPSPFGQAPESPPELEPPAPLPPLPPAAEVPIPPPVAPSLPDAEPVAEHVESLPGSEPEPGSPPVPASDPETPDGPKIRPEPRHMKERVQATPMSVRHATTDDRLRRQGPIQPARTKEPSRVLLALIPAVFCAAATLLSGWLLYRYLPTGPWRMAEEASAPLPPPPSPPEVDPAAAPQTVATPDPDPAPAPIPATQAPAPPTATADPAPEPPPPAAITDNGDGISPAVRANQLLDAFLHAKDGQSRLGMVEPEASLQDLQSWDMTKGPLWEVAQVFYDLPQNNPKEQVTDYPYRVSFFIPNRKNVEFAMLVRQRGSQPPKVFLPAFLDLAGGRLAAFAKEPNTQDPTKFHVVLEPLTGCHEENIPNPDRKFTLRLLPSTIGKEAARAYVSTGSRFKKMMDEPESSLRWGVRLRATVTLQWNHKEDPEHPYLELIDINSLGWNP